MAERGDWEGRYVEGDVPWDTDEPASELVAVVERLGLSGRAIELGCGTGASVAWLAANGFATIGLDVSATAIARARARLDGLDADLRVGDLFDRSVLPAGAADLVFDRGVFHLTEGDARGAYVARVAELLAPGGVWVSLVGNRDQPWEGRGPPRWTATEIASAVEPRFRIRELAAATFGSARIGEILAWRLVASPR